MTVAQGVLLGGVAALQLAAAVGMLVVRRPLDRLHLVGPVSVLGSIAIIVAAAIAGTSMTHLAKTIVTGLVLWASSPFVSRATARALRIRSAGHLVVTAHEIDEGDGAGRVP